MSLDDYINFAWWGDDEDEDDGPTNPEEEKFMRRRHEEEYVDAGEVEVKKVTRNAMLCLWKEDGALPKGTERWVPFSQSKWPPGGSGVHMEGDIVQLQVTEWFSGKLAEDNEPEEKKWVELSGAVVMRATDKAIQVRLPNVDDLLWLPRGQIAEDSEVKDDGDSGVLKVSQWIAEQKNLVADGAAGGDDPRQQGLPGVGGRPKERTAGEDARSGSGWGDGIPEDDDIPF